LTVLVAGRNKIETSSPRLQLGARRCCAIAAKLRTLAVGLAAVAVSSAPVAPAYADGVEIVSVASGLRVDVMWASTSAFQGAFLWPDNASASQEFYLIPNTTGYYHIVARHSGQCLMLDWREGVPKNGTRVIQFPAASCGGGAEYLPSDWLLGFVFDNCNPAWQDCQLTQRQIIVNRYTKKCLDAGNSAGGAPGQGAVLQQWDCISSIHQWNAGNQLWTFTRATSGP
jgi:hypothetical protein